MSTITFHPKAEEELNAAAGYYEQCKEGLGISFIYELEKGFQKIEDNPLAWELQFQNFRRYLLHRFPYSIVYRIENESIFIVAIAHSNRKSKYWKDRV